MVKDNITKENQSSQLQNNKKAVDKQYHIGQEVLVAFPKRTLIGNIKFEQPYKDGYMIEAKLGVYTYIIKNVQTNRRHTVHADLLKAKYKESCENVHEKNEQSYRRTCDKNELFSDHKNNPTENVNTPSKEEDDEDPDTRRGGRALRSRGPVQALPNVQQRILERKKTLDGKV